MSNRGWLALPVFALCFLSACSQQEDDLEDQVLIRVGDRVMTVFNFNRAFEITKAAYPPNTQQQSVDLRKAKLRLLNQMTIEMVILEIDLEDACDMVVGKSFENTINYRKSDRPRIKS